MNRTLVVVGLLVVAAGPLWTRLSRLPLFRLPGDTVVDRPGRTESASPSDACRL